MSKMLSAAYVAACVVMSVPVFGAPPAWWQANNVSTSTQAGDNHSPANVGQLKNIAAGAASHLGSDAGPTITDMLATFTVNDPENFAPANIGQLIRVAKPFYDRLNALGYNTRESLIISGYPASWPSNYPWDSSTDSSELYAPVNIGQLKLVFSFDLNRDSNGDGLTDIETWINGFSVIKVGPDGNSWDLTVDSNDDGLWDVHHIQYYQLSSPWAASGPSALVLYGPNS